VQKEEELLDKEEEFDVEAYEKWKKEQNLEQ